MDGRAIWQSFPLASHSVQATYCGRGISTAEWSLGAGEAGPRPGKLNESFSQAGSVLADDAGTRR